MVDSELIFAVLCAAAPGEYVNIWTHWSQGDKPFHHFIDHMWDEALFDLFTHFCLICDLAKTLTSMHDKWPEFHAKEVGFPEQRALFDRVVATTGRIPPVIDNDDLLARPVEIVRAWCAAVGLPFIEAAPPGRPVSRTR